jgi:hypothetical protein
MQVQLGQYSERLRKSCKKRKQAKENEVVLVGEIYSRGDGRERRREEEERIVR